MSAIVRADAAPSVGPTVEESLRRAHDQLCLAAELFDLQAVAPDAGWADGLSSAACAALSGLYRQASQELAATLDGLPAAVLNRAPDHQDDPTPRARDAGGSRPGVPADDRTPDPRDGADR